MAGAVLSPVLNESPTIYAPSYWSKPFQTKREGVDRSVLRVGLGRWESAKRHCGLRRKPHNSVQPSFCDETRSDLPQGHIGHEPRGKVMGNVPFAPSVFTVCPKRWTRWCLASKFKPETRCAHMLRVWSRLTCDAIEPLVLLLDSCRDGAIPDTYSNRATWT